MKRNLKIILMIGCLFGSFLSGYGYVVNTTNETPLIYNNSFNSGLSGWTMLNTAGLTTVVTGTSSDGRSVIKLRSLYSSTTISKVAGVQTWDGTGLSSNYHVIDFTTTYTVLSNGTVYAVLSNMTVVRDGIIIKVWAKGSEDAAYGNGTVTGTFAILLQSAVALPSDTTILNYDITTFQSEGFKAISPDIVFGRMTTWNVFTFNFIPSGQCDWWQIRNLQLSYTANQNQATPTELWIDRIELWVIRIDAQ